MQVNSKINNLYMIFLENDFIHKNTVFYFFLSQYMTFLDFNSTYNDTSRDKCS